MVGQVVRVEQTKEADLELAVFALGGSRLLVWPGVLPLGIARRPRRSGRSAAEAKAVGCHCDGAEADEVGRIGPVALEVRDGLLPVLVEGLGLDQAERDPVD